MGKICCWLIIACRETQDLGRADDWCRRVEAVCQRRNLTPLFNVCRIQHSSVLMARGAWPQAEHSLGTVLTRPAMSRPDARLEAVALLGELRRRQGRWAEARELLEQAEFHPSAVVSQALIQLAQGEPEAAWQAIGQLLLAIPASNRLARAGVLWPAVLTADAAGDRPFSAEIAESAFRSAVDAAQELQEAATLIGTDALAGLAAAAAATLADAEVAPRWWREAVRRFHDAGLPFDEAESRLQLARSRLRAGDVAAAGVQAQIAIRDLASLGATAAIAEAVTLNREMGTVLGGATGGRLTEREAQVLRLVADGMSNQQIADALVLSPHTVHRHLANILTKLNQPTRAGATAYAITNGLI